MRGRRERKYGKWKEILEQKESTETWNKIQAEKNNRWRRNVEREQQLIGSWNCQAYKSGACNRHRDKLEQFRFGAESK